MGNASNSDLSQFRIHGTRHLNGLSVGSLFEVDSNLVGAAAAAVAVAVVVDSNFAAVVVVVVVAVAVAVAAAVVVVAAAGGLAAAAIVGTPSIMMAARGTAS